MHERLRVHPSQLRRKGVQLLEALIDVWPAGCHLGRIYRSHRLDHTGAVVVKLVVKAIESPSGPCSRMGDLVLR